MAPPLVVAAAVAVLVFVAVVTAPTGLCVADAGVAAAIGATEALLKRDCTGGDSCRDDVRNDARCELFELALLRNACGGGALDTLRERCAEWPRLLCGVCRFWCCSVLMGTSLACCS